MATTAIIIAGVLAFLLLLIVAFIAANWAPERSLAELRGRWAPAPSLFVDVAGLNVHMRDEGPADDPTPVVLLHGTGSSLHAWDGWVEALKETRRVIRFEVEAFDDKRRIGEGRHARGLVNVETFTKRLGTG